MAHILLGRESEEPAILRPKGDRMAPDRARPRRTVLVVEEAMSIRVAVAEFLRNSGFRVLEAASGVEADAILSVDMSIDVVCLHMQMPGNPEVARFYGTVWRLC
jgi:response regulator RpfG family c-di-GMP phosphodiesterase